MYLGSTGGFSRQGEMCNITGGKYKAQELQPRPTDSLLPEGGGRAVEPMDSLEHLEKLPPAMDAEYTVGPRVRKSSATILISQPQLG
jgi:hypothetical protein